MKKIISLVAIILTVGSLFTGCQNPNNDNSKSNNENCFTLKFDSSKIEVADSYGVTTYTDGAQISKTTDITVTYKNAPDDKKVEWSVNNGAITGIGSSFKINLSEDSNKITGTELNIAATLRDLLIATLVFDDTTIICEGSKVGESDSLLKNGSKVTEDTNLVFRTNKRELYADTYNLNDSKNQKITSVSGTAQVPVTVNSDNIKNGKINFSYNTHESKTATVIFDKSKYNVYVQPYGVYNAKGVSTKYYYGLTGTTAQGTTYYPDVTEFTVYEGDVIAVRTAGSTAIAEDVLINDKELEKRAYEISLNEGKTALCWYDRVGKITISDVTGDNKFIITKKAQ